MDRILFLKTQADECRRAAESAPDRRARQGLRQLAAHYDQEARHADTAGRRHG